MLSASTSYATLHASMAFTAVLLPSMQLFCCRCTSGCTCEARKDVDALHDATLGN